VLHLPAPGVNPGGRGAGPGGFRARNVEAILSERGQMGAVVWE